MSIEALFRPFSLGNCQIPNRFAMAPMTRGRSPNNLPNADNVKYYAARTQGGVGLVITEGVYVNPYAGESTFCAPDTVPRMYGEDVVAPWKAVVDAVHQAHGVIFPQLWHTGSLRQSGLDPSPQQPGYGPSAVVHPGASKKEAAVPMTLADIEATLEDFARAALFAKKIGFDGVEIHGAHGYLIDQFFWEKTNQRTDAYGGDTSQRTRFACDMVQAIRSSVGPDFPIALRFSQWKIGNYEAKPMPTPQELEQFLHPLTLAGVDIFHCSTRNLFQPEFPDSSLNLAGWTKKITGKPTITVGSVGITTDFLKDQKKQLPSSDSLSLATNSMQRTVEDLAHRIDKGEFDMVALGRILLADPGFPKKVQNGAYADIVPYHAGMLQVYP